MSKDYIRARRKWISGDMTKTLKELSGSMGEVTVLANPRTEDGTRNLFVGVSAMGFKYPERYRCLYVLWSLFVNLSSTLYLPFGFLTSWIVDLNGFGPSEFLTSLQVGINAFSCSSKVVIFAWNQYRLREAATYMRILDERCTDPDEKEEIRSAVKFCNTAFNFYIVMYWLYSTSTFVTQYIRGTPPYSLYNPFFNWRDGLWEFRTQAIIEYFLMNTICFQDVVVDVYPVIYINLIRAHFKILTKRFHRLGSEFEGLSSDERLEELIKCMVDHKTLMQLFKCIGKVISGTLFVQLTLGGLVIGTSIVNMLIFGNIYSIIATSCFLFAVMLETFPISYFGNCLLLDNENLSNSVFHSNWLHEEVRYKKMLVFFMQNVQKPPIFMALKMFTITVESNMKILKFAFSIYTLIHQMDIAKYYRKDV